MNILELTACAAYSNRAYGDFREVGFAPPKKYENRLTSTTFFWMERDDRHYIIFRGSQQPRDFLVDALALPVPYLGNWVHGGFALSHVSIRKKLKKILEVIQRTEKPLIFTGHSLGAAQSELSFLYCEKKFPKLFEKSQLIVFGKPRCFLKPSRERFPEGKVMSCVSGSDVVTRLPRFLFTVGSSNQDMFYLANDGSNLLNADPEFVKKDFDVSDAVSDHSMNVYLQRLKEIE